MTAAEEDWFLARLQHDGLTRQQAEKAELWILRSNEWTFRGTTPRLDYADMWPDAVRLAKVVEGSKFEIITTALRERLNRLAQQGQAEAVKNLTAVTDGGKNDISELTELMIKLNSEKMALVIEVDEMSETIRDLRRKIEQMER